MSRPSDQFEQRLQATTWSLIQSAVPERAAELEEYWREISPRFALMDEGPYQRPLLEGGPYGQIRFNHRMMRLFWVGAYVMWEGYLAFDRYAKEELTDISRFQEFLDHFFAILEADSVERVPYLPDIPPAGELVEHTHGTATRPVAELAVFAVAWAFLHEVRHLIKDKDGSAASSDDSAALQDEELDCDRFATRMLLEMVEQYALATGQSPEWAMRKRQTAVLSAVFTMTLLARDSWNASYSHPALQERIDGTLAAMSECRLDLIAAAIGSAAFISLSLVHPDAPSPLNSPAFQGELTAERLREATEELASSPERNRGS